MRIIFSVLCFCLLSACSLFSRSKPEVIAGCLASREYITTLEYIRTQKEFALNEKQARELANKVSLGCTGASKRFIQVTNLLIKSDLPSQKAIETAMTYAHGTDEEYLAFISVFKSSYLESLLDLDLERSLNIATDLSLSFKGDKKVAEKEFTRLVDFCVSKKSLDLPLMECAKSASRIIKSAEPFDFNVGSDFIEVFNYVTDNDKANIPTYEALKVAETVVKFGPEAKKSFVSAYEYAVSKKGLDVSVNDAIEFGKTMASRSIKKEEIKI